MQPEFDKYSQSYSEDIDKVIGVFGQKHDFFVTAKTDIILTALAELNTDTKQLRVLDVGCGVGLVHPYLVGAVASLHGAEVSAASLDVARRNNPDVQYALFGGYLETAITPSLMPRYPVPFVEALLRPR